MAILETKTIKAPTLYSTDNAAATQFNTVMESIKVEKVRLLQEQATAEARALVNEVEVRKLQGELRRTNEQDKRVKIKASIQELIAERENLFDVMAINIKEVITERIMESGVLELEPQAAAEHSRWITEINGYLNAINKLFSQSKHELAIIRDQNIYKQTKNDLENFKSFIQK